MLRESLAEGILTLTLDRPDKRNALSTPLIEALHSALDRADLDAGVRVVLLRGEGAEFCAGADLDELLASAERAMAENEASALRLGSLSIRLRTLPKASVAVVQGRALAGGAGLAMACDIVVAEETSRFGFPEVRRGFVPAMVMAQLRRLVGEKAALDLVLTGRLLSASEALSAGLVSRLAPAGQLLDVSAEISRALADSAASAVALTKQLFYRLDGLSFEDGIAQGARVNALARRTPEFRDSISRFLGK